MAKTLLQATRLGGLLVVFILAASMLLVFNSPKIDPIAQVFPNPTAALPNTVNPNLESQVATTLQSTALAFHENQGQLANPAVRYYFSQEDFGVAFTEKGVIYRLTTPTAPENNPVVDFSDPETDHGRGRPVLLSSSTIYVHLSFDGANSVQPVGRGLAPYTQNYIKGNKPESWVTGVRSYARSNEVSITLSTPVTTPSAPQNLIATAGELYVSLSWDAPTSDGGTPITQYYVYRGNASGQYSLIQFTTDLAFNDTLVTGRELYYYAVTAVNVIGESSFSTEVAATPTGVTIIIQDTDVPSPTNLTAITGDSWVSLSWVAPVVTKGPNINEYNIFRGLADGTYQLLGQSTDPTYNDTTAVNEENYFYMVTAVNNKDLQSLPSNVVFVTIPAGPIGTPTPGFLFTSLAVLSVIGLVRGKKRLRKREKN